MNRQLIGFLLVAGAMVLGVEANGVPTPVCERADVAIASDGVRCAPTGTRVFVDSFADTNVWPRVLNYEKRLNLVFNHRGRNGTGLLVDGEKTPHCDTAWNVGTARRKLTAKGPRFRFSFRISTTSAIAPAGYDTECWWTAVRWFSADGSKTNVHRVGWCVPPGRFNEVVDEGDVPAWADEFAVQIGFDCPNVCEGRIVEVGRVCLEVLSGEPCRTRKGWFCSEALEAGPVSWEADVPAGCAVRFQCAVSETLESLATAPFRGPDGTDRTFWDKPFSVAGKYMRYRGELLSDGRVTPVVKTVTVGGCVQGRWASEGDGLPPRVKLLMPSPTTDAHVPLRIKVMDASAIAWKELKVSVDGVDATARFRREGNVLALADPSAPWTNGLHNVEVDIADWHGNKVHARKCFFIGEAPKTAKVTLRDDGMTLIDGEPFFPVGIYGVMRREFNAYDFDRAFADLKKGGFNFAHSYSSPHEDAFLDAAWKHGIRLWTVARFPGQRFIDVLRHHPATIAWYLGDDTSANTAPERLLDYDDAVKAVDPTRITTQADGVGAGARVSNYGPFVEGTDNFLAEIYPVHVTNEKARVECVAKVIRDMKRVRADVAASGVKAPRSCWPIIQYFKGWGWQRFPMRDELDAMSWASIIHGGQGITWYTYGGTVEPERKKFNYGVTTSYERWTNMTNLATRISSLAPVLVERTGVQPPIPEVVKGPARDALGNEAVSCLLKRHAGKAYLFAVNSTPTIVEAKFKLANVDALGEVLWENRKVKSTGGILLDRFDPFAVHIYVFDAR